MNEAIKETGRKIGRAMARDVLADRLPREWTGLDPQDAEQIPAELADCQDEIELAAYQAYVKAIEESR